MVTLVIPEMLDMTPEEWRAFCDKLDREGVPVPETAADIERDAAVVATLERIVRDPPSIAAARSAAAALRARKPAAGQPALVTPGMVSEEVWLKAASKHGAYLERLRREFEDSIEDE